MLDRLATKIWEHEEFHLEAGHLHEVSMQRKLLGGDVSVSEEILARLLQCAISLAGSSNLYHREMAYRITTSASEFATAKFPGIPFLMLLALSRIGNFPALDYAKKLYGVSEDSIPMRELGEITTRRSKNSIPVGDSILSLTDFQKSLWDKLNQVKTAGISAPTSAGKSFVFQTYARHLISSSRAKSIVFLVPSRALINQVSGDVSTWLSSISDELEIVTTPIPKGAPLPNRGAYVLTQERLQLLQTSHDDLVFELMLVDEAQGIADGPRGVLLYSVIEEALKRNSEMQLLFAGPNLAHPGALSKLFDREEISVTTNEAAVIQNIIFVDTVPEKPRFGSLSVRSEANKLPIGELDFQQPLVDHRSKLVNVALRLGAGGQSLLYALGPAECEDIAFGLADADQLDQETDVPPYLQELSEFIKEAVHPKFQLSENVLRGIGYHYGRLPSLVRKSVEDAFSEGKLKYLVTTSTLLHGVNMPARNLFLHNPQKGNRQPISSTDFWNLAGRAGRLGKEFSGNIFLIDYPDWEGDPMSGPKEQQIVPAFEKHLSHQTQELVNYISDSDVVPDRDNPDEFENTFAKLVRDEFDGTLVATLQRIGFPENSAQHKALRRAVQDAIHGTNITKAVLSQSPTVSIHRQQALYDRIEKSLRSRGPAYVIPKHPLDGQSYPSYVACIKRCHDEVLKYSKSDNSHRYYALIIKRWMSGQPIPQIVDASYKYKIEKGQNPSIATVIRVVLREIENDLRFKYVRLFSCYNSVLEQVLRDNGRSDLVESIPAIPMYLEVGACSTSMLSFMGLGLSRFTSNKLRSLPRRQDMSQSEARNWIRSQDVDALNLPLASIREIKRLRLSS